MKLEGGKNDLVARIKSSPFFSPIHENIEEMLDPKLYIGRAPQQVGVWSQQYDGNGAWSQVLLIMSLP